MTKPKPKKWKPVQMGFSIMHPWHQVGQCMHVKLCALREGHLGPCIWYEAPMCTPQEYVRHYKHLSEAHALAVESSHPGAGSSEVHGVGLATPGPAGSTPGTTESE